MRLPPAPPEGSGSDTQPILRTLYQPEPGFAAGPRRRKRGLVLVIAIAVVAVAAGAGAGTFVLLRSNIGATPTQAAASSPHRPAPTKAPPRLAFTFQVDRLRITSLRARFSRARAAEAAAVIARRLGGFYDHAFADPTSWKTGVPNTAWNVFAASVRARAKADANSFTPATTGVNLVSLAVTTSRLSITVLLDTLGRPQSAFANVIFQGTGDLKGGQKVTVDNAVTFLLQPISGTWVIVGYPEARTKVETETAGGPGSDASPSPSAGSSP
jgi:hypothetical protein